MNSDGTLPFSFCVPVPAALRCFNSLTVFHCYFCGIATRIKLFYFAISENKVFFFFKIDV